MPMERSRVLGGVITIGWSIIVVVCPVAAQSESSDDHRGAVAATAKDGTQSEVTRESRPAAGILPYVLDRAAFDDLCVVLRLSSPQRRHAESVYSVYRSTLADTAKRISEELEDQVAPIRSMSSEERSNLDALSSERREIMRDASEAVRRAFVSAKVEQIGQLQVLCDSLGSTLTTEQSQRMPIALRRWHRDLMLNQGAHRSGRDLSWHADLVSAVEQLREDHPAFEVWDQHSNDFHEAMLGYEEELDVLLTLQFWTARDESLNARTAILAGDTRAASRSESKSIDRWLQVYRLNERTLGVFQAMLQDASLNDAAGRLTDAFRDAYFPFLYAPKSADIVYERLCQNPSLTPNERVAVDSIYEPYLQGRKPLRRKMEHALLHLVQDERVPPARLGIARIAGQYPDALAEIIDQRREMNDACIRQMMAVVSPDLQEAASRIDQFASRSSADLEF